MPIADWEERKAVGRKAEGRKQRYINRPQLFSIRIPQSEIPNRLIFP
jgi:hypothetical protein